MDTCEEYFLREGRQRSAPPVLEIHEAIRVEGEHELSRPVQALAFSALAAGLSMGFSFLAEAALQSTLPEENWTTLITKVGYAVGFLIVILGRQQLFTENTLTPVITILTNPSWKGLYRTLRLWVVVLFGNMVGAAAFAAFLALTPVFHWEMQAIFSEISLKVIEPGTLAIFLRAILGGWLIALMVWLLPFAESARIWVIMIITYLVGIGHLAHIVAGSVEVFFGLFAGVVTAWEFFSVFWLPALLGNILGGVAFVATLHQAQVHFDRNSDNSTRTEEEQQEELKNPFGMTPALDLKE